MSQIKENISPESPPSLIPGREKGLKDAFLMSQMSYFFILEPMDLFNMWKHWLWKICWVACFQVSWKLFASSKLNRFELLDATRGENSKSGPENLHTLHSVLWCIIFFQWITFLRT